MKYPLGRQTVEAVYDNAGSQNPLIEALPLPLDAGSFMHQIKNLPPVPAYVYSMTLTERKQALHMIPTLFVPMDYMYYIYDSQFRMLQSSYHTLTSRESVQRVNALFSTSSASASYGTQAQSGALLGTPGLGKTTTLKRCLMMVPQVSGNFISLFNANGTIHIQTWWLYTDGFDTVHGFTQRFSVPEELLYSTGKPKYKPLLSARNLCRIICLI